VHYSSMTMRSINQRLTYSLPPVFSHFAVGIVG